LLQHCLTLGLDFIFEHLGVLIWSDGHRRGVGQQMDPVIQLSRRRQPRRRREQVVELSEEGRQGVGGPRDCQTWRRCGVHSCPAHLMIMAPERHGELGEVLDDESQGAQPIAVQDEVVAFQREDVEVGRELFVLDGHGHATTDAGGGHAIAVRDAH